MAKKNEEKVEEDVMETPEAAEAKTPRVAHDFHRDDLNDLRDAVNELHARG